MSILSPQIVSLLAKDIYQVQTGATFLIRGFLNRPEFSQKSADAKHLKAEVGSRIINTKDGFGMCVRGGKGYEKDLFLIFRGSTTANIGADWISNARIGVERSQTGLPVHIGFNSIFCSMKSSIEEFLANHQDAQGTVHCIGHSLGGAIATLAADWVSSKGRNVKLYTIAAPKAGLEFFADRLTTKIKPHNIYRVYHATDVVPMIPVYPFAHPPFWDIGYQLPSSSLISLAAHKMQNYINSISTNSWESLGVIAKTAKELTQAFMRQVLQRLLARMADEAMRVVRDLVNKN